MPRKRTRKSDLSYTTISVRQTTKNKLKRIVSATKRGVAIAADIAIDHELDRLGLARPEADPSARNMTPESET